VRWTFAAHAAQAGPGGPRRGRDDEPRLPL
jgi:hypothetical protein